jgi:hypothetical protein
MNPHFDYIRIATWNLSDYLGVCAEIMRESQGFRSARWLQYVGRRSQDGRTFFGMGEQNRTRHHVIQFSGGKAEETEPQWKKYPDSFYCTRLDVQVTIAEPDDHDAESLYKSLNRKGKSIVKSPGCSTVYLGVRTSDLFARIYEKPIDGKRYLRCEFELKGQYARSAFALVRNGDTDARKLFQQCLHSGRVPEPHASWFTVKGDEDSGLTAAEKVKSLAATESWLKNTEIGIMRHLGFEDTRGMVLDFIDRLEMARSFAETLDED